MQLVVVAKVVFTQQRPQHIAVVGEEVVETYAGTEAQVAAQGAVLHTDNGFGTPCLVVEHEAGKHLHGVVTLVTPLPAKFLGEVQGVGLHKADAPVMVEVELP